MDGGFPVTTEENLLQELVSGRSFADNLLDHIPDTIGGTQPHQPSCLGISLGTGLPHLPLPLRRYPPHCTFIADTIPHSGVELPAALREKFGRTQSQAQKDGTMSPYPHRRLGVSYLSNGIYFDIIEEVSCIVDR